MSIATHASVMATCTCLFAVYLVWNTCSDNCLQLYGLIIRQKMSALVAPLATKKHTTTCRLTLDGFNLFTHYQTVSHQLHKFFPNGAILSYVALNLKFILQFLKCFFFILRFLFTKIGELWTWYLHISNNQKCSNIINTLTNSFLDDNLQWKQIFCYFFM